MAIPSGSGTEVLKSVTQSITGAYTLTPTNDHILVILNIIVKNNHSSVTHFDIKISKIGRVVHPGAVGGRNMWGKPPPDLDVRSRASSRASSRLFEN